MASSYNGEVNHNPLFMSPRELLTSNSLKRSFKVSSLSRSKEQTSSSSNNNPNSDDSPGYDSIKPRGGADGWYTKLLNPLYRTPDVRSRSTSPRPLSPSFHGYSVLQTQDSSCELMKDPSNDTEMSGHYSKIHDKPTVAPFVDSGHHSVTENPYIYDPLSPVPGGCGHNDQESDLKRDKQDDLIHSDFPPPIDDGTVIYESIATPEPHPQYDSLPDNNGSEFNPYETISS